MILTHLERFSVTVAALIFGATAGAMPSMLASLTDQAISPYFTLFITVLVLATIIWLMSKLDNELRFFRSVLPDHTPSRRDFEGLAVNFRIGTFAGFTLGPMFLRILRIT